MQDHDDSQSDSPLTQEEEAQASLLTAADLERIDACLLSQMSHSWQKVARVILLTMIDVGREFPSIPDGIYSRRIRHLVRSGAIEAIGNLNRIRFSEIWLLGPVTNTKR